MITVALTLLIGLIALFLFVYLYLHAVEWWENLDTDKQSLLLWSFFLGLALLVGYCVIGFIGWLNSISL